MCKFKFRRPIFWSLVILAFLGCKKDQELAEPDDSDYAILIVYEEETRSSFSDLSHAPAQKNEATLLAQEVNASRQQVKIGIMDDGSCIMQMKRMNPKHSLYVPGKASPARADEVHSMRFENGQVSMYNADGSKIGQERAEMPSYKELVKQVKENNNSLTRAMYSNFLARQRQKSAENAEVVVKEDGDYTIVSETVTPECGMDPAMNGYTVSNIFETATGVLAGSSILDQSGTTVFRSVMTYDEDKNNPLPSFSHEESFGISDNGEAYMITTLRYVENVEITVE